MSEILARREMFRKILGGTKPTQNLIAPPYFSGKFACEDCEAVCVDACKYELLTFENGRVNFSFKTSGCTFCKECAIACQSIGRDVLNLKFPAIINAKFIIEVASCLAWNGTTCYSCQDVCKFRAIDFLGVFRPTINERCVGCAQCMEVCFVNSIKMEAKV